MPWADIEASEVHHWPIVRAYAERIGLRSVINRVVPTERAFEPGLLVMGMVVDTLSGRSLCVSSAVVLRGQGYAAPSR